MSQNKKSLYGVVHILILFIAILILFRWYTQQNNKRIVNQNLNYAMDSARQTARDIEREFGNALNQVNTYTYFLEKSLSEPVVDAQMLGEIEENSAFDVIRFTNAEGINLASDGRFSDATDRDFYLNGMKGESGISVVFNSRITDETMIGFYAPVSYQGKIIGILRGVYLAKKYLQDMLNANYFGEEAGVFLCTQSGKVIASSAQSLYEGNLFTMLSELNMVENAVSQEIQEVFENGGEGFFICNSDSETDNICVIHLSESQYILVQTFPKDVTQSMTWAANRAGVVLEVLLIGLFLIYIAILFIRADRQKHLLEQANKEMSYVISGVNTLFSRFVMVDLEAGTYQYLAGTKPERKGFALSGEYDDFLGYLCSFLVKEDDRQKFAGLFGRNAVTAKLEENGTDVRYEYLVQRNGHEEWEHLNIIGLEKKGSKITKALIIRQNITEVKEREMSIRAKISVANRKERQYRVAITSDSVCTYDFNLTSDRIEQDIVYITKDGEQISMLEKMGLEAPCKASEVFEMVRQFVTEESLPDYCAVANTEYLTECFNQGIAETTVEYWREGFSAEKLCVRQSFIMTQDDDTGDIMVMVVTKDITEQVSRQMEQTRALQDALAQARHASNAKSTFLFNMSHDIRTPMNAIIGFATIASTHIDNKGQVKECLQKVLSSSNHLLSIINDILDMSRIESGKVQIKERECNISEMMHSLVDIIQPQVKAKQLELFIDTFDIVNEDVIADPLKLNQVFVNLLSNAIKYTPMGGTISFQIIQKTSFRRGYGDYIFVVRDTGIGMSPEFVEHIFEPFEREASVTKTGIQGTGLGMAITKNIVDMMGGTITLQSEKGHGSEFRIELNLKLQDTQKKEEQIKQLVGQQILIVDDDEDTCSNVGKMLKYLGMFPTWTTSSIEAVSLAKEARDKGEPYDTYMIDWQMPQMGGMETAKKIRGEVDSQAPIIILTAYDWTEIEAEARAAGVTAFCAKPLFLSDLKSVLFAANHLADKQDEPAAWTLADFGGKRVLLVEDNELNREIAEEILTETGFVVECAPDGTDAVSMVKESEENYYDVILMDVQMPIMDGYEATRTIRALSRKDVKDLPIIAMTANALDEDKEAALKNGMNAHIGKPVDMDLFMSVLRKYLK